MNDTIITLNVDGLEIPVTVVRKRVKNLNLRVRSDGSVALSIPQRLSLGSAREFLERKSDWIAERVRRNAERKPPQHQGTGLPELIPLWGELVPRGSVLPRHACMNLDDLYRAELGRALPDAVERMERRVGVHATRWSVRAMKTRWGSCTPKTGAIRINARLAAYPPECLEFVVAHELVHLMEPSHNARFHALLDKFCPDNRAIAQRLKKAPVLH